jgi:hypothetical protein
LDASTGELARVSSLAACEHRVVDGTAVGNRTFIDTNSIGPVLIVVRVPNIKSIGSCGTGRWGRWKGLKTVTGRLARVSSLAACEHSVVDGTAIGNRTFVDTNSIGPVLIVVSVPNIKSIGSGGTGRWGRWKGLKTGTGRLARVSSLAACEHSVVGGTADGERTIVDTCGIGPVLIVVWIPNVKSITSGGTAGRWASQLGEAKATSLPGEGTLAACKLRGVGLSAAVVVSGAVASGPITGKFGVVEGGLQVTLNVGIVCGGGRAEGGCRGGGEGEKGELKLHRCRVVVVIMDSVHGRLY